MVEIRDWSAMRAMCARLVVERTGEAVESWNRRIAATGLHDANSLRNWLEEQGVTGYARAHLIRERFGYPDFLTTSATALIDAQYADRTSLRPIYERLVDACTLLGDPTVQARKTYVSLLTPRRTFARIQPTTRSRLDLGLRLEGRVPSGRLRLSRIHPTMPLQVGLSDMTDVDEDVLEWLRLAYEENS